MILLLCLYEVFLLFFVHCFLLTNSRASLPSSACFNLFSLFLRFFVDALKEIESCKHFSVQLKKLQLLKNHSQDFLVNETKKKFNLFFCLIEAVFQFIRKSFDLKRDFCEIHFVLVFWSKTWSFPKVWIENYWRSFC